MATATQGLDMNRSSMSSLTANFDPDAGSEVGLPPSTVTLRRGASIFFRESARMLEKIFEFLYLGEIAVLEDMNGNIDVNEYSVWMFLLTWYAPRFLQTHNCSLSAKSVSTAPSLRLSSRAIWCHSRHCHTQS
jgi:hypothetical protein